MSLIASASESVVPACEEPIHAPMLTVALESVAKRRRTESTCSKLTTEELTGLLELDELQCESDSCDSLDTEALTAEGGSTRECVEIETPTPASSQQHASSPRPPLPKQPSPSALHKRGSVASDASSLEGLWREGLGELDTSDLPNDVSSRTSGGAPAVADFWGISGSALPEADDIDDMDLAEASGEGAEAVASEGAPEQGALVKRRADSGTISPTPPSAGALPFINGEMLDGGALSGVMLSEQAGGVDTNVGGSFLDEQLEDAQFWAEVSHQVTPGRAVPVAEQKRPMPAPPRPGSSAGPSPRAPPGKPPFKGPFSSAASAAVAAAVGARPVGYSPRSGAPPPHRLPPGGIPGRYSLSNIQCWPTGPDGTPIAHSGKGMPTPTTPKLGPGVPGQTFQAGPMLMPPGMGASPFQPPPLPSGTKVVWKSLLTAHDGTLAGDKRRRKTEPAKPPESKPAEAKPPQAPPVVKPAAAAGPATLARPVGVGKPAQAIPRPQLPPSAANARRTNGAMQPRAPAAPAAPAATATTPAPAVAAAVARAAAGAAPAAVLASPSSVAPPAKSSPVGARHAAKRARTRPPAPAADAPAPMPKPAATPNPAPTPAPSPAPSAFAPVRAPSPPSPVPDFMPKLYMRVPPSPVPKPASSSAAPPATPPATPPMPPASPPRAAAADGALPPARVSARERKGKPAAVYVAEPAPPPSLLAKQARKMTSHQTV